MQIEVGRMDLDFSSPLSRLSMLCTARTLRWLPALAVVPRVHYARLVLVAVHRQLRSALRGTVFLLHRACQGPEKKSHLFELCVPGADDTTSPILALGLHRVLNGRECRSTLPSRKGSLSLANSSLAQVNRDDG